MATMTQLDLINLISAIASGVLAIVALALSIVFFVLAKRDADRSADNASKIAGSVDRLEKLFDTLYSDTFSMMRDTYTDMRKHVWRAAPVSVEGTKELTEEGSNADVSADQILEKITEISEQVGVTGAKLEEFQSKLQPVLAQTLEKQQATREEQRPSLRRRILRIVQASEQSGKPSTLASLLSTLGVEEGALVAELFELGRGRVLGWDGAPNVLVQDAPIRYIPTKERAPATKPTRDGMSSGENDRDS